MQYLLLELQAQHTQSGSDFTSSTWAENEPRQPWNSSRKQEDLLSGLWHKKVYSTHYTERGQAHECLSDKAVPSGSSGARIWEGPSVCAPQFFWPLAERQDLVQEKLPLLNIFLQQEQLH